MGKGNVFFQKLPNDVEPTVRNAELMGVQYG
jgi:hypothetical protein